MKPKKSASDDPQGSLFQVELVKVIDISHPLAVLAGKIDWDAFEKAFGAYFCGMKYFEHEMPIHPTSMTRWRKKVGDAGMEKAMGRRSSPELRACVKDGAYAFRQILRFAG